MQYSQTVKNLVSGISQQPPILRLPEQLEEQINGISTEVAGLQKRPPTVHVKALSDRLSDSLEPLIHFVNRDSVEKYLMYFYNNSLSIFDIDGGGRTVHIQDDPSYLATSNPRRDLRILTVADYTFIVNRNWTVRMTGKRTPNYFATQGCLVHVKSGQYGRTYTIWADGREVASWESPDGSDKSHTKMIDTNYIVGQLVSQIRGNGLTADSGDCWIRIYGVNHVDTKDGFNNQAMIGIKENVQRFSLLPATAPADYCVKVDGDPNGNDAGSYYVKYNASSKVWEECSQPNIDVEIDASTMPHALIRNGDGTFTFKRISWTERKIGDNDSNPYPSFVNHTLNDIFFHRNRLGLLSGENVVLSESAEYFNWWLTTANDVLDTDCIDVPTTTTQVNILHYAVVFNEELYCFSDNAQFVLRSDTVLSPKNTALIPVTGFNSSPDCRPVEAGKNLYFTAERAEYSSIKEYYSVQNVSDVKNAQDITSHVAAYIPNGVYQITSNTNENIMLFLTTGDQNCIYVYKYLFVDERRVQASWSKWDFGNHVFGVFFVGSTLYVLVNRGSKHMLEKINFTYNTMDFEGHEPYRVYIDRKRMATTAVYDPIMEQTTFNVVSEYEGATADMPTACLVFPDGTYQQFNMSGANGKIVVNGNQTNKNVVIGVPYVFRITLSPIYIRRTDNNGGVTSMTNGRLTLRNIKMNYTNTGGFVADVQMLSGKGYQYIMTGRILGSPSATLGAIAMDTGVFRIPIQSQNNKCTVIISSDMPLPVALVGYTWEGNFVQTSKGV